MKKGQNKMMSGEEKSVKTKEEPKNIKKDYVFPAQNGRKATLIKADSLEAANKIYNE